MPVYDQLFRTVEEYDSMSIQYLTVSFTFSLCAGSPPLVAAEFHSPHHAILCVLTSLRPLSSL